MSLSIAIGNVTDEAMVNDRSSDEELFEAIQSGNEEAFTLFYRRHTERLRIYLLQMTNDHEIANDLMQTVWIRIIDKATGFGIVKNPLSLTLRIARNAAIDHLRAKKPDKYISDLHESEHPTTEEEEISDEEILLQQGLAALNERDREILVLHNYAGYSFEEIGKMMGRSANAVCINASRARTVLRSFLTKRLESAHGSQSDR